MATYFSTINSIFKWVEIYIASSKSNVSSLGIQKTFGV
jgi:hypothetical protein